LPTISRIRLAGFKSFVDPVDVPIEPGLTGIVGPNGCGKSNLVEALRWVMGESAARQLRGDEMDDVIFGGCRGRPARNLADVILDLDNEDRTAPPPYTAEPLLEVSRRIDRGRGSTYRINGRAVRARDVHMLFADSATGARSAAMVTQGQVASLIAARPTERRGLLEEAAGIVGLHARRHEADSRLRAAEANLERLDDLLANLDDRLKRVKSQARLATRYRGLSSRIRTTEATLFWLNWQAEAGHVDAARQRVAAVDLALAGITGEARQAAVRQAEAAAAVPELRHADAQAAAEVQRLAIERQTLDAEQQRIEIEISGCRQRLEQIAADVERERALAADADATLARLDDESERVRAAQTGEAEAEAAARAALERADADVSMVDAEAVALTARVAATETEQGAVTRRLEEARAQHRRLDARAQDLARQRDALTGQESALADETAALAEQDAAEAALTAAQSAAGAADTRRTGAGDEAAAAERALKEAELHHSRLVAEHRTLESVLGRAQASDGDSVLQSVEVPPGLEAALAAALGEDLLAPITPSAPAHWRTLPSMEPPPPLPDGAQPLGSAIRAPDALHRRLDQIGVVDGNDEGERLLPTLRQGQRLVSAEGAVWRWDGLVVGAGGVNPVTARLQQRNRLADLDALIHATVRDVEEARTAATRADRERNAAREAERTARTAVDACEARCRRARSAVHEIATGRARLADRAAALEQTEAGLASDLADWAERLRLAEADLAALPSADGDQETLAALRRRLAEGRRIQAQRRSELDALSHAAAGRRRRLAALADDTLSWRQRRDEALGRVAACDRRRDALTAEFDRLAEQPESLVRRRQTLLDLSERAELSRQQTADALAAAEARLAAHDRELKAADHALATAREDVIRAQSALEHAEQAMAALTARIRERLALDPEALSEMADTDAAGGTVEAADARLAKLIRERDAIGPVNLCAEDEAAELINEAQQLDAQKRDLIAAIDKLRRGLADLDAEGRERVTASFAEVDRHFQTLFHQLFGGGRAHLSLTESDDPLTAGLEIMASPPGKRLQSLALLSGGEQALTALALRFALFLTHRAPICVLDEVDAPLDDANVDRFCALIADMAARGTRFLVITHHRLTMARMDRLFGVTMAERGVSQLVSVDLHRNGQQNGHQGEPLRRSA